GELCQKPVGKNRHSAAQTSLLILLARHPAAAQGKPRIELGFRFPRTSLGNLRVPDVSYYLPGYVPDLDEDYPERAPDLAAEVRSKGQSIASQRERLTFLRAQGTRCTLLIDPEAQTVEVHDGERTSTASGSDQVRLEQLAGFSFSLSELWA
ncbi:MAG: Uma2 family endonuclease, partial [Anaerolineaceae bacterium]